MNRPRRARSPPFGYEPRGGLMPGRPPPEYDDPHYAGGPAQSPFEPPPPPQSGPGNMVDLPHQYSAPVYAGYREHRSLPSAYRGSLRNDPSTQPPYASGGGGGGGIPPPATYKILCITNINHKVSDGPVKDALINDFSRFGDISVSICHDNGERLAYIYFRTYEEAREAKHVKSRALLFDRPMEIEPIYEPRSSPSGSPPPPQGSQQLPLPPQQIYSRRRSMTPPNYYGAPSMNGAPPLSSRRHPPPTPLHRGLSPEYPSHSSRYPAAPISASLHPSASQPPYAGRGYYMPTPMSHMPAPYPPSPSHDPAYKSYHHHHHHVSASAHHPTPYSSNHAPYHHGSSYGAPPMPIGRERERGLNHENHAVHPGRSPRNEGYYPGMDQRGYGPAHPHSIRSSATPSGHHQNSHPIHHQPINQRTPPMSTTNTDHPRSYLTREYRREKFGSESYGNEPEEGRPSRVLIVTNIYSEKTELDLRDVFEPFGMIEELELRKIAPDVASALIKYSSMDCAYKAKTATNGKYIGSLKCRMTYGKVSASRRLWIGNLGPSTTVAGLEDEFGKFGNIVTMDYTSGRPYAYIEFESANQAQFASHHLKGTLSAGAERKIRVEFVDPVDRNEKAKQEAAAEQNSKSARTGSETWSTTERCGSSPTMQLNNSINKKRSITPTLDTYGSNKRPANNDILSKTQSKDDDEQTLKEAGPQIKMESNRDDEKNELNNNSGSVGNQSNDSIRADKNDNNSHGTNEVASMLSLSQSKSIREIIDCCPVSWFGQLVLRNFNFPSKMFMCSGDKSTIEKYITKLDGGENADNCPILRITQRWRLHPQPKLEKVKRRMQSGNLGMLIITSRPDQSPTLSSPNWRTPQSSNSQQIGTGNLEENHQAPNSQHNGAGGETLKVKSEDNEKTIMATNETSENSNTQSKPLKNLINYLEQKDAAGVISLTALDKDQDQQQQQQAGGADNGGKLLYTFPPGDFAMNLLKRNAPNLMPESSKEEFLLGVIIGNAEAIN